MAGYKINTQKLVVFLYASSELEEKESREKQPYLQLHQEELSTWE